MQSNEKPSSKNFSDEELRVCMDVEARTRPFIWDERGSYTQLLIAPSTSLLHRLMQMEWLRNATMQERMEHFLTVPRLRAACADLQLPKSGDKSMLIERLISKAPDWCKEHAGMRRVVVVTPEGRDGLSALIGAARGVWNDSDRALRRDAYQKSVQACLQMAPGHLIHVVGNSWSNCPKLRTISGLYHPEAAPDLPPLDCPMNRGCTCWSHSIVRVDEDLREGESGTIKEPAIFVDVEARPVQYATATWQEPVTQEVSSKRPVPRSVSWLSAAIFGLTLLFLVAPIVKFPLIAAGISLCVIVLLFVI